MKLLAVFALTVAITVPPTTAAQVADRQDRETARAPSPSAESANTTPEAATESTTEAGIRIWKPVTIRGPGHYVVIRNVSAPGPVIDIQSSDVEIDLNGFVLENTSGEGSVIQAFPQVLQNVTITNGTVRGGTARGNAIDFTDAGTANTSHGDNYVPDKR